jgi:hypothetical protein
VTAGAGTRAPRVALVVFFVVLLVATAASATTSPAAYSAYNTDWDGTSALRLAATDASGAEPTVVDTAAYGRADPTATVAFVVAPSAPYTEAELAAVRSFVEDGGTLVVAGDRHPEANRLLAGVGAAARIDGRPLRDERSFFRTAALPVVRDVREDDLTEGVFELTLNHPSAVDPNGARVLAATSGFAYVDAERNAVLDLEEELRSYPVVAAERVGEGRVVTVSDPSLFVNGMAGRSDNARFRDNLVTARAAVVLDFSHGATVPPFVVALGVVQRTPPFQALFVGGAAAAVALWTVAPGVVARVRPTRGRRAGRRTAAATGGVDAASLRASLRRTHPDWEPSTVDRVAAVVARRLTDDRREADA